MKNNKINLEKFTDDIKAAVKASYNRWKCNPCTFEEESLLSAKCNETFKKVDKAAIQRIEYILEKIGESFNDPFSLRENHYLIGWCNVESYNS